ncbi:MAG: response regulator [Anaerolineae bacterium]|jgi:two-component system cell cycle response regulator DivK|nr:response regulator [Anaerolineae bacterium]
MPRILYIDDDLSNRLLVRRVLGASGMDVEDADNARTGIQKAVSNPPDLILMDISMPDMDGLAATAEIRSMPIICEIPIIALTANVMQGDRERTLSAGCDGYIGKPIDVDTFAEQVSQYLKLR